MYCNPFSDAELARRLTAVRQVMAERDLGLVVLTAPESVFYLTGLDHWGYFAPHYLIVPAQGELVLVTRAMERVAIANQVRNARFSGHADTVSAAEHLAGELAATANTDGTLGIEADTWGFSYAAGAHLADRVAGHWCDISGLLDQLRLVKSPEEQAFMRRAARVSDAGMIAAIAAIHDGANEADVAAECLAAMTRAGGAPAGFGPFIRPHHRIAEEHTTWGQGQYHHGERVMLELAGCVARYNAPMGRLVHIGSIRDEDAIMAELATSAFDALMDGLKPGVRARDVYDAWHRPVAEAGLADYHRHHCGYLVGIGFPPSWTGGNRVTGLRRDSDLEIREGMTFHAMSWFTETGAGDYFVSNCVLLGEHGAELLTQAPMGPTIV